MSVDVCALQAIAKNEWGGVRTLSPSSMALLGMAVEWLSRTYQYTCAGDEVSSEQQDWMEAAVGQLGEEMSKSVVGMTIDYFGLDESIPAGWMKCDGTTMLAEQLPDWFAIAPDIFKFELDDVWQVQVPDTNRMSRRGTHLESEIGLIEGNESMYLTVAQLPPHTHTEVVVVAAPELVGAGAPLPTGAAGAPGITGSTGDGEPIDLTPYSIRCTVLIYVGRILA